MGFYQKDFLMILLPFFTVNYRLIPQTGKIMNSDISSINVLLCQFKLYTKDTVDLIHRVRQGGLDSSATTHSFKRIEENTKIQILIVNQIKKLVNLHSNPDEFDVRVSILDFKCYLNQIDYSVYCLREGRLDRSTTIQKFKVIEDKCKLQMLLLNKLLHQGFN